MRYTSLFISSLTILILVVFSCALTNKHLKRIGAEEFIDNSKLLYETGLPVHAHLDDGSVVIFENGFYLVETTDSTFMNSNFRGAIRYSLDRQQKDTIFTLDYSKVAYVDVVEKRLDGLAFLLSLPGALITSAITAVAIFGSCPTVYSMDGNIEHLEAECFSYSINPRFEMQDVDKLEFPDFKDGILKLELRNEALETHYINTFKVLTVDHEPGHKILPKESGSMIEWKKELIEIGPLFNDYSVRDKLNNDISQLTAFEDEQYFSSSDKAVEEAVFDEETNDWIIMDLNLPEHQTELFLGFKLRSTLLNTVLLYDLLLDAQNLGAIDWTGTTSQGMWYAYNFAKWYHKNFGLHIEVLKNGEFVEVTQLGDSGPIVWSKLGVKIPLFEGGQTSVRFKFITDNWHID
ncbi:MAG: hypothetical protein HKO89_09045 [Saprospiraceae bacterium]|nr:hypothetical protein [Saprospiraceae bacterium]